MRQYIFGDLSLSFDSYVGFEDIHAALAFEA